MSSKSLPFLGFLALLATSCQPGIKNDYYVEQVYQHKYGLAVEPEQWYESGCNGQVFTTLRDGVVVGQSFSNGMLNGESSYTYPNSEQIQRKECYEDDTLISEVCYSPAGVPEFSKEVVGKNSWIETRWYESGHPRSIEKYEGDLLLNGEYYTIENKKDSCVYDGIGERITRDVWGNLISIDTIRGGELAVKTTRHPNGSTFEVIPYSDGVIHGERKTYYPGGDPMAIETWSHGERTGTTVVFQNGERYAEVPYIKGKKNGVEKRYKDGSVLTQEISWADDKMDGPTYTYLGDGVQTDWFYKGRLTTRTNFESFGMPKRSN